MGGSGEDELCGRILAGLPLEKEEFATYPPHLSAEDQEIVEAYGWNKLLPGYNEYPPCFQRCVPYLFASIVYHYDTLKKWFKNSNSLWSIPMLANFHNLNVFKSTIGKILTGQHHCSNTLMKTTGVPGVYGSHNNINGGVVCCNLCVSTVYIICAHFDTNPLIHAQVI